MKSNNYSEKYDNLVKHIAAEKKNENQNALNRQQRGAAVDTLRNTGAKGDLHYDAHALLISHRKYADLGNMIQTQIVLYHKTESPKEKQYIALELGTALQDAFNEKKEDRFEYLKDDNLSAEITKIVTKHYELIHNELLQARRSLSHNIGQTGTARDKNTQSDEKLAKSIITAAGKLAEILNKQETLDAFKQARSKDYSAYQEKEGAKKQKETDSSSESPRKGNNWRSTVSSSLLKPVNNRGTTDSPSDQTRW